jgi:hypothetical protein
MIDRIRGDHDARWARWRPARQANDRQSTTRGHLTPGRQSPTLRARARRWRRATWGLGTLAAVIVLVLAGAWGVEQLNPTPAVPVARLPATPRAWLDAYLAAAVDDPQEVCSQLFAPQLTVVYAHAAHSSCPGFFGRMTSSSVIVRRMLSDGATTVLELRQKIGHADWAVVLDRRPSGWQAVDLLTGDLLR